jgi:hypothetical protein
MGYCITLTESNFTIKATNKDKALEAIRALANDTSKMSGGSWGPGGETRSRHFSWVTTDDFFLAKTIVVALEAWRYEAHIDEKTGDVVRIEFSGEKLGDDPILWRAVAPFVEDGSYLQMSGEDGTVWRWVFKGGAMTEVHPSWPDE